MSNLYLPLSTKYISSNLYLPLSTSYSQVTCTYPQLPSTLQVLNTYPNYKLLYLVKYIQVHGQVQFFLFSCLWGCGSNKNIQKETLFALALNLLIILLAQFGATGPALSHASAGVWQGSDFTVPAFGYNKSQL